MRKLQNHDLVYFLSMNNVCFNYTLLLIAINYDILALLTSMNNNIRTSKNNTGKNKTKYIIYKQFNKAIIKITNLLSLLFKFKYKGASTGRTK